MLKFDYTPAKCFGELMNENSKSVESEPKEQKSGSITTAWFKHYDKKLDRMEALLESSYLALNHLWWMFFGLFMLLFVIPFLGWFAYTMGNFSW